MTLADIVPVPDPALRAPPRQHPPRAPPSTRRARRARRARRQPDLTPHPVRGHGWAPAGLAWMVAAVSRGTSCSRWSSAWWAMSCASVRLRSAATVMSASARRVWPIQRIRSWPTSRMPRRRRGRRSACSTRCRVDGVHQPGADLARGRAQHAEDRDGDDQADDRVGPGPAERDAAGAEQHGQAGEAVGAGVQPVGDQRGRADPPPDADAVAGHDLVAGEPDDRRGGDRPQVLTGAGAAAARSPRSRPAPRTRRSWRPRTARRGPRRGRSRRCSGVVAGRRPSRNATSSGTAVSASATLCSVSPSSATDPDRTTTTPCSAAVRPGRQADHQCPATGRVDSSASSTWSAASCECPPKISDRAWPARDGPSGRGHGCRGPSWASWP